MRFNQYSYSKTNPNTMRQELADLGFIYEPHLSDKDNLQSFLRRCFFLYQDRDYLLRAWAADSETDLLTFFESDRELTAEVFYMTAFQLLDFVPFIDFTDLEKFRTESNFPIVYGDLLENLYQLLNTRTKNGNLLIDKKGNVKNVFVERSSGYAPVDEAVKKAILQWKFTPAIGTDQKAHESIIGMTITLPKQAVKAK